MTKARPSGRRIAVISLLAILVAAPAVLMGPLRSSDDSSADAASYAESGPQIRRLYLAYFHREPDSEGWRTWLDYRHQGYSLEWVSDRFAESEEFRQRYGALSNDDFVRLVYRLVLDREPDPTGWEYWRGFLNSGRSRGWVMMGFSESLEFQWRTPPATTGPASQPLPPEPTPSNPTPPPATGGGQAGGTSSGGLANVASGLNVDSHLIAPWNPNPEDMSWVPSGNFRTFCEFSHLAYEDPIILPGSDRFMHLHQFFGNTGANRNSTYQSLRTSGQSTCEGGVMNRTAYWMPATFDAAGAVVVPENYELYYKAENTSSGSLAQKQNEVRSVQSYPNGLRMVAGAPQGGISGWKCATTGAESRTIPDCPAGSTLTAFVRFPYCWDGKNLDSADHRSHMAYGTNNTWGGCPASHPVHVPELTEFAHYKSDGNTRNWYLSSDRVDPARPAANGSTFHADWFGAWEDSIEDRWVQNCLRGMSNSSNGNLCDGRQLQPLSNYRGPSRISGYTPSPR